MASEQVLEVLVRRHVFGSDRPFASVLDGVFGGISQPDIGMLFSKLAASTSYEQFSSLVAQTQGSAGLIRFLQLDLDHALTLDPQAQDRAGRRPVRLIAGNPVTMGEMTRHVADAGWLLHGPRAGEGRPAATGVRGGPRATRAWAVAQMTGFLAEIGSKLADRWAALLVLPGLLYAAAVTAAAVLGQQHALSYASLTRKVAAWANSPALRSTGGTVLLVGAILAGSVLAGLVGTAGGRFIETLWTMPGRRVPARWLAEWRRARSRKAKAIADNELSTPSQVAKAIRQADRICLVEADRPTWIGDRLRACYVRVQIAYGLDLSAVWPRLWLVVSDTVRGELGGARDAFSAAARLTAWASLYLILGAWWWPALSIALVTGITAVRKARLTAGNLADLIESAVDLYGGELATQLGVPGPLTPAQGRQVSALAAKSRWNPASPLAE